jgi:hypothetical protein
VFGDSNFERVKLRSAEIRSQLFEVYEKGFMNEGKYVSPIWTTV